MEGLGPGQLVGRQALASPALGDIQLGICERKSCLEVEVIRARGLQPKPNAKLLPGKHLLKFTEHINVSYYKYSNCSFAVSI